MSSDGIGRCDRTACGDLGDRTGQEELGEHTDRHDRCDQRMADISQPLDVPGLLRRVRRLADLSQRDLAHRCEVSPSTVARAETGVQFAGLLSLLVRALQVAGLRLVAVTAQGGLSIPMRDKAVRDHGGRRFPAHLDPLHVLEDPYYDPTWRHHDRPEPWFTFRRDRQRRNAQRQMFGCPPDHPEPANPSEHDHPSTRMAAIDRLRRRVRDSLMIRRRKPPWKGINKKSSEHAYGDVPDEVTRGDINLEEDTHSKKELSREPECFCDAACERYCTTDCECRCEQKGSGELFLS